MRSWVRAFLVLMVIGCGETIDRDLPDAYRDLVVPTDRLRSEDARSRGAEIFRTHCALCHGPRGDGHGVRLANLSTPARDLTSPVWRAAATPRRTFYVIREGVAGSAMPAWKSLSVDETWDVVAHVLTLAEPRTPNENAVKR